MAILAVVLLVIWAIVIVVGFAFDGLLWLAIAGIILFAGTVAVALLRLVTLRRRSAALAAAKSTPEKRDADASTPGTRARTAADQKDEIVADDSENPAGDLE